MVHSTNLKIAILVADNLYGTTRTFARGLRDALIRLGVEAKAHFVGEGLFFHALYDMLEDPPDYTFSFADIHGLNWSIPHFTFTLDPVLYVHEKRGIVTCVDERDAAFAQVPFLPHEIDPLIPQAKEWDTVFFGSCLDVEAIEDEWADHPDREALYMAAHQVLHTDASLIDVVQNPALFLQVDRYVRAKDRIKLCQQFPKLSVWGHGPWKKYLPHATVYPAIPFEESLAIMARAKRLLNSSPRIKAGLHERILYAWSCDCRVVTAKNRFVDGYTQGEWSPMEGVLGDITPNTWDVRAQKIIDLMCVDH